MTFRVDVAAAGGVLHVRPRGELDLDAAPKLLAALNARPRTARGVDVDFAGVTSVDPSALAVLIEGKNLAARAGVAFRLVNVAAPILDVIRVARLERFFTIVPASGPAGPKGAP